MITAKFKGDLSRGTLRFIVEGHAGQAEPGKDIVCAAASILTLTLAQMMMEMHQNGKLEAEPLISLNDGKSEIIAKCKGDFAYKDAEHIFDVAYTGFAILETKYPEYVRLVSES